MEQKHVISVNAETGEERKTDLVIPQNFDWGKIEKATAQPNVAPKYFEFNVVGQKLRGFYLGKTHVEKNENGKVKVIPVVVILTQDGAFMNGGVSLVDTISKFCRVGEAIEVEYLGDKKVTNGKMKEYAVRPLKIS
jgi:hypothetical protein